MCHRSDPIISSDRNRCVCNCRSLFQYCEFYPDFEKCRQWLEKNLPTEFEKVLKIGEKEDDAGGEEEKKRQKRGGKGMVKPKKKEEQVKQVYVSRAPRGKKKSVTVVTGLSTFGNYLNAYFFVGS